MGCARRAVKEKPVQDALSIGSVMRQLVALTADFAALPRLRILPMRPASRSAPAACLAFALVFLALGLGGAAAADFRLGARSLAVGAVKISASALDLRGSDLSQEALERLLDPTDPEPAATRWQKLNIARVDIPELTLEMKLLGQSLTWRYRNVTLANIRAGLIGEAMSPRGTGVASDPSVGDVHYEWGTTRIERLDAAGLASVTTGTRAAGEAPRFREIIGTARIEAFSQKQGGFIATQAVNTWRGMAMSAGFKPWGERFALVGETMSKAMAADKAGEKAPKPEPAALADMLSLLEDVRFGTSEIEGAKITFAVDKAKGIEEAGEVTFRRIATSDTGDIAANSALAQDISGIFGDARFTLKEISLKGFSAATAVSALRASMAAGKPGAVEEDIAKFIPKIGRLTIAGLDINAPAKPAKPPATEATAALKAGLGEFVIDVRAQENGTPSDIRIAVEKLSAPVPRDEVSSKQLLDLGYTQLEVSSRIDLGWDRTRNEIALRETGLEGRDMLNFRLSGVVGNASKDLFAPDLALMQVAALGLNLQSLQLRLENLGLFDRLLKAEATKAGKEPAALRRDWSALAAIALPAMLGDSPAAKTLAGAVARFIASPRVLSISATAPQGGIGLADVIAAGDPKAVLGRVEIKAEAQ
jgi:hypothetical protein